MIPDVFIGGVRYVPHSNPSRLTDERPGDYCRRMRAQMGVSLSQLSAIADINLSTIADFENGCRHTRVSTIIAIARGLGLSLDRMFGLPGATP